MPELTVRVVSVDVACDSCGLQARLGGLEVFAGWSLAHYQPRVVSIVALIGGHLQRLVPR